MLPFRAALFTGTSAVGAAYGTAESLAEQSTTNAELTGVSITETFKANTNYLWFWSVDVQSSTTASSCGTDIEINGISIFSVQPTVTPREVVSPVDYYTMGGSFRNQVGAVPISRTFTLKARRGPNAATLKCRNARLSFLEMGSNDVYAESLARQTFVDPANKTDQTAATLSFTSPSSGDYIIIAYFNYDLVNSTNVNFRASLSDGTTTTGGAWWRPPATTDRCPGMLVLPLTGISGAKTITLKVAQPDTGATTIGISDIRMVALRSDRFVSVRKIQSSVNDSGTESAYITALSQTFTPAAADHLTLACWAQASTSTTASIYGQYLDGADSLNEFIREFGNAATNGLVGVSHRLAAYGAVSRTQAIQRHGEGAINNVIQSPSTILTIELTGIT